MSWLSAQIYEKYKVPKLTLQPLIENSIYHGIKEKDGKGIICVSGYFENGFIIIEVFDTGIGISPEKLKELRQSLSESTDDSDCHFGISSVIKRLNLHYNGQASITIGSQQNQFTCVTLSFPAIEYYEKGETGNMLKIFIIDDEYFERQSLIRNINWSSLDIKVSGEANNGLSAFETISKEAPDIAIVDINMPKMNGLDLISLPNENNISCKYIILTGYDEFEYAQKAIKLNVFDYILKPINYENLEKCLRNLSAQIYSERQQTLQYTAIQNENRQLRLERYYNDLINCNFSFIS
ncbi:MAG: response regulator [Blautia faecis]